MSKIFKIYASRSIKLSGPIVGAKWIGYNLLGMIYEGTDMSCGSNELWKTRSTISKDWATIVRDVVFALAEWVEVGG